MATRDDSLIQVHDLKKHYHRGAIKALDGVTVDINKGDVMVVIGPSGSGKSTFLRSLNLLEEPTGGEIIFNGVDITKMLPAKLSNWILISFARKWEWYSSTLIFFHIRPFWKI